MSLDTGQACQAVTSGELADANIGVVAIVTAFKNPDSPSWRMVCLEVCLYLLSDSLELNLQNKIAMGCRFCCNLAD